MKNIAWNNALLRSISLFLDINNVNLQLYTNFSQIWGIVFGVMGASIHPNAMSEIASVLQPTFYSWGTLTLHSFETQFSKIQVFIITSFQSMKMLLVHLMSWNRSFVVLTSFSRTFYVKISLTLIIRNYESAKFVALIKE